MTRKTYSKTRFSALAVVIILNATPVRAALWQQPDLPSARVASKDMTAFDRITRIGTAQTAADPYCDFRPVLPMNLSESYGETLRITVNREAGTSTDLGASDDFGTWTAINTCADGVACVIGSGENLTSDIEPGAALAQISL